MQENLNIDIAKRDLILKALNKHWRKKDAMEALGISETALQKRVFKHRIVFKNGKYVSLKQQNTELINKA